MMTTSIALHQSLGDNRPAVRRSDQMKDQSQYFIFGAGAFDAESPAAIRLIRTTHHKRASTEYCVNYNTHKENCQRFNLEIPEG